MASMHGLRVNTGREGAPGAGRPRGRLPGRGSAPLGLGLLALAVAVAGLMSSCSGDKRLLDEQNPYFLRGIQLRKQNRYAEAAEAFRKCLRFSWTEASAHLQLGMLCEDHLDDPVQAVVHYRAYLKQRPEAENAELVHRWVERGERACLAALLAKYPEQAGAATAAAPRSPPSLPQADVTERERRLAHKLKELNTEILALRRELYTMAAGVPRAEPEPRKLAEQPAPAATAAPGKPKPAGGAVATYVVKSGDTLSKLSRELYGSSDWWPKLRDYNVDLLKGSDRLAPGMRLKAPAKEQLATWAQAR